MNNILKHVEQVLNDNKHKLIGNYDFSEEEYSSMVDYVGDLCNEFNRNHYKNFDVATYKIIFTTLVEIAKRWKDSDNLEENEEKSGFWVFILNTLTGEKELNQKLYSAFTTLISQMDSRYKLPIVKTGKKYYATLMMHSYAPKSSIYSFFDLCYNIFKKDLDFGFTKDDEWLCEIVASQIANILSRGYSEDKLVSIGSSAYSIKIGLRSLALNEDLTFDFVEFIKDIFYQINKLFNRQAVNINSRLERYIVEWWKNKTESEKLPDETVRKNKISTVSKQNIVAKYVRDEDEVILSIPPIRLDDLDKMHLFVFVEGEKVHSEEMRTKRGELVISTKQIDFELNSLLKGANSIDVRIEIEEDGSPIFDSEKNKANSLRREFILFEDEKEIFSQINKPTNYFVYSKDVDALKSKPKELTTCARNLYNIYPLSGETLASGTKKVLFINKEKIERLGEVPCLIGDLEDTEWLLDEISCTVYVKGVKLLIPANLNIKALELKIDSKPYKLQNLKYELLEDESLQFELKRLGLISDYEPIEVSLYSFEKEAKFLAETIIVLPNLDIQFNRSVYYGNTERIVHITAGSESKELTWTNQDNEIKCPLNEGVLLIKIPYFKWRINEREWHNEPNNRKLWFKDFIENGDFLEIDNPKRDEETILFGKADGELLEITKNHNGKFEIGRAIYANENKKNISVYFYNDKEDSFTLFNIASKEQFIDNPLLNINGNLYWDVENTFIGEKNNDFFLIAKAG